MNPLLALVLWLPVVEDDPAEAALVLAVEGKVTARPAAGGEPRRLAAGEALHVGDKLAAPADGAATLALLGSGRRVRFKKGQSATVVIEGLSPADAFEDLGPVRPAFRATLRNAAKKARGDRFAAVVPRGEPPHEGTEAPPPIAPIRGSYVASDRPTLSWKPDPGAKSYRVQLFDAIEKPLWSATTEGSHLDYPADRPALARSRKHAWKVFAVSAGGEERPLWSGHFTVATAAGAKRQGELAEQARGDDPAEALPAALALEDYGAHDDVLRAYEHLARLAPREPAYPAALARSYQRAGRPEDAKAALRRAEDLGYMIPAQPAAGAKEDR
jgi:hypothetical protein